MKQKIVGAIAILIVLALAGFKYYTFKNPDVIPSEPQEKSVTIENVSITPSTASSINIQTDRPVNGKKLGVIEVGASGFNSFVVEVDKQDNWELISKEFGESLAYEGFITTIDVQNGLKKYLAKMFERGVAGRNAHFVISSGALKNKKTELIAKAIEDMGYVVNKVNADQEAKYALKALLPKSYRDNSFVVDIGSGNTKITSYKNGVPFSVEAPGAKYYQDSKTDAEVATAIKVALKTIPTSQRENCFIIGGVPFKLAKEARNGEERFTLLKSPEDYSFGDDVKLKSGLVIYSALVEEIPTKYIFDWDANFTIGFLLTLN